MAIVHQSSATNSAASGTSLTITKPTGTVATDVLLAWIYKADTPTFPTGWVFVVDLGFGGGGGGGSLWYKIAGGSEPASYTITQATSGKIAGGISRYSGVDNTTPIDCAADYQAAGGGTSLAVGPVTTATANAMVVGGVANLNSPAVTPPAGLTERWEIAGVEHASAIQAAAGSTGSKTWTFASSTYVEAFLVALRESGAVLNVVFGAGIPSAEVVGQPAISGIGNAPVTFGTGIPSAEAVGQPTISQVSSGTQAITFGTGIPSAEAVGQPTLTMGSTILDVKVHHRGATDVRVRDFPIGS